MFLNSISSVGLEKNISIICMKKIIEVIWEYLIEDWISLAMLTEVFITSMGYLLSFYCTWIIIENSGWSYVRWFF